jgi:hypothetical protein
MGSRGLITTGHSAASTLGEDSRNSNTTKGKVTLGLKNLDTPERRGSRRMRIRALTCSSDYRPRVESSVVLVVVNSRQWHIAHGQ